MAYFPLFFDLHARRILIVGGGRTAYEKACRLLKTGARIFITAREINEKIRLLQSDALQWKEEEWNENRLEDMFLVIAATDDLQFNRSIAECCRKKRILCNVVDSAEDSSVVFGSVIEKQDLSVGISTSGASPSAAIWLRKQIESILPEHFDAILLWLGSRRRQILETFPPESRSALFHALFDACMEKGEPLDEAQYRAFLENFTGKENHQQRDSSSSPEEDKRGD